MTSRILVACVVAACGSTPAPTAQPVASAPVADAAVDAPVDALPDAVVNAAPLIFRYHTADRSETWTLRHAGGTALLVVETAQGAQRYIGAATEGETGSLAVEVSTTTAKLALTCKREKLPVGAKCNDRKAKPIDVLSCYHVDFKAPMPFAAAPGVEYVVDPTCNGYRLIAP